MIEITIKSSDSKQRVDKYLIRLLPGASKSLLYKQIRKKNITLNDKKIEGSEKLNPGDVIKLYFAKETYDKFKNSDENKSFINVNSYTKAYETIKNVSVVYEDENIIVINKPVGLLSQGSISGDMSLNDWLIGYLLNKKCIDEKSLNSFKPSILNRLDRNTSGMVIGSKSIIGAITISDFLKDRSLHKYYLTIVMGKLEGSGRLEGYHKKDSENNKVIIKSSLSAGDDYKDYDKVITEYKCLNSFINDRLGQLTLLEIKLITGKSHQIRAHLSSIGHPILGDFKYSSREKNLAYKTLGISNQLLHAYKVEFPKDMPVGMGELSDRVIECEIPSEWRKLGDIYGNLEK